MNALDFLVDFAALVSTSEALRPDYGGNNVDHNVDLIRSKSDSASEMSARPLEKFSPVNGERPMDTLRLHSSMAPSLSQHTFPAHAVDRPTSITRYHDPYEEFFAVPSDPHMSQSFDQFLRQRPGPGLPFATPNDTSYLACDCERLAHWDPSHEMNYLLPVKPASWDLVQPQHHPPNHDMRFSETQFVLPAGETPIQPWQCMDAACHCQYTPLNHQTVSNGYATAFPRPVWGLRTSIYDKNLWKENDECIWRW